MPRPTHPLLLLVLDGWGIGDDGPHDAIHASGAPNLRRLGKAHAATRLGAAGPHVGLPEGQMGNSEVGHLNLGAGRLVYQDIVRIHRAVADQSFHANAVLGQAMAAAKNGRLHLLGLLGPGGVHSHQDHLVALVDLAARSGVRDVVVHHLLDGRDTPPQSAKDFAAAVEDRIAAAGARVASVAGRYWTMDRDRRWERTARGYRLLVAAEGHRAASTVQAIEQAYDRGETDEFVAPTVVGEPAPIRDGDVVVCTNFRPDRMRQIVRMLADPDFSDVPRRPVKARVVTMTMYDKAFEPLGVQVAFPPDHPKATWGEHYARLGLRQLRVAETEKYAHVTYFFNGGLEAANAGEDRILVPSPKVATYDERPEMNAEGITERVLANLSAGYDLIVVNFANADMVAHTGRFEATVAACRVVDACVGRIAAAALKQGCVVAVTADHGNAERMVDAEGRPQTAHTTSDVPFILATPAGAPAARLADGGVLSDVAPTLLALVGLPVPPDMTGKRLLVR